MRLIDADALNKALGFANPCANCKHVYGVILCEDVIWQEVCDAIYEAPTIDAVQVVRCKDCVNFETGDWCVLTGARAREDGYCAWGEWKEDEED